MEWKWVLGLWRFIIPDLMHKWAYSGDEGSERKGLGYANWFQ